MRQLLTFARRTASTARSVALSVIAPASLFTTPEVASPDLPPVGLFEADEMPAVEDIDAAARTYAEAADQGRRADRGKRAARKILDRLPIGTYGNWAVDRVPSGRETVDLEAVRKLFKQHGLGPVPMKTSAPSLKVKQIVPAPAETTAKAVAA